ncbi:MAG: phosphatase PAP2 family protein [Bacteroidaceae bacterium]|nr:phosphatase PAP2 family protein [Bacteroidaceae bacterium]
MNSFQRILLLSLAALLPLFVQGQNESVSLHEQDDSIAAAHAFKGSQLIVPGVLITAGVSGFFEPVKTWKETVRDNIREMNDNPITAEDYVQYMPAAGVLLTNLLMPDDTYALKDRILLLGTSYALMGATVNALKYTVISPRPDIYDEYAYYGNPRNLTPKDNPHCFNSFPSGHTATAFMGAELARLEYGDDYPLIAVGAYALAAGTGFLRVWNERHWCTDVLAGAGMGILSARIAWWLLPYERQLLDRICHKEIAVCPRTNGYQTELAFSVSF